MPKWLSKIWILQSTCTPRASCDSALLILSHAFCTLSTSQQPGFVKCISLKKPCHSGGSPDRGQKFKRKVAFTEFHSSIATSMYRLLKWWYAVGASVMTCQKTQEARLEGLDPRETVCWRPCPWWSHCPLGSLPCSVLTNSLDLGKLISEWLHMKSTIFDQT